MLIFTKIFIKKKFRLYYKVTASKNSGKYIDSFNPPKDTN